jgi:hypothetical protein
MASKRQRDGSQAHFSHTQAHFSHIQWPGRQGKRMAEHGFRGTVLKKEWAVIAQAAKDTQTITVLRLRFRFVRQDLACVHSFENLPAHEEVTGIQSAPFPRLPTTRHIHPFLPQTVSQGQAHLPPSRIQKTPYRGFWRSEVHVLRLRIRFVRQDLTCGHCDGFGSSLLTQVYLE